MFPEIKNVLVMNAAGKIKEKIFSLRNEDEFTVLCLEIFRYQVARNKIYRRYCTYLGIKPEKINKIEEIPFLPIRFFREHDVISGNQKIEKIFTSSSTSGQIPSRHLVSDISLYEKSFLESFQQFYGSPANYCFFCLLPSYLERPGSSLIYMTNRLNSESKYKESGYFLYNHDELYSRLTVMNKRKVPVALFGVSFALVDFAAKYQIDLSENTIIIETGGMKGRKKEMTREELHDNLTQAFGVKSIHSEYGMTELLSQAYSKGQGLFRCPPWMKVLTRDLYDPFAYVRNRETGALNVIDLANIYSCSFIETSDMGKSFKTGEFEVTGRVDTSETRGCNLMVVT